MGGLTLERGLGLPQFKLLAEEFGNEDCLKNSNTTNLPLLITECDTLL